MEACSGAEPECETRLQGTADTDDASVLSFDADRLKNDAIQVNAAPSFAPSPAQPFLTRLHPHASRFFAPLHPHLSRSYAHRKLRLADSQNPFIRLRIVVVSVVCVFVVESRPILSVCEDNFAPAVPFAVVSLL